MGDLSSGSPAMSASRASSRHSDVVGGSSSQQRQPGPLSQRSTSSSSSSLRAGQPDVVFVSPPDPSHVCPVCDRAMRYPVKLGQCGHRCCSGCLIELVRSVTTHHQRPRSGRLAALLVDS